MIEYYTVNYTIKVYLSIYYSFNHYYNNNIFFFFTFISGI